MILGLIEKSGHNMEYKAKNGQSYQYAFSNISYNCAALKLFGYSTERSLFSAIEKVIKKANSKRV
jgi:hypothetical protein